MPYRLILLIFFKEIRPIQKPAEVFFEDMIFNFGSYYDYLAKFIFLFHLDQPSRHDWRGLIKELNKKQNRGDGLFENSPIEKATVDTLLILNRERVHPLYDYRSHLIHNEVDAASGKKTTSWKRDDPESLASKITIGMPAGFSETIKLLSDFKIKTADDGTPDIFGTGDALFNYFWNTNIQIINLIALESNKRNKTRIPDIPLIVDGV